MTRFGYVMTTYFAMLVFIGLAFVHPAPRPDLERHGEHADRALCAPAGRTAPRARACRCARARTDRQLPGRWRLPAEGRAAAEACDGAAWADRVPRGDAITVDHIAVGAARERDHLGRPLPRWNGCHTLSPSEVFLMNPTVPDSLDGRYFGPLPTTAIVARAVPLWTDEAGDGRFVWRARTE